ncbi:MAG: hypothetical protein WBC93_14075 [Sulfitobacter sp.]
MFKRLFSAAVIFGAAATAPPLWAQTISCMPRDALVQSLQAIHKEKLTGGGLQNPQQLLEVWSSEQSGRFTVFVTRPDGISCVVATGKNWNSVVPKGEKGITG